MKYGAVFQSTFPRGERLRLPVVTLVFPLFQSTFPRGERHLGRDISSYIRDFNPRSRVGNDKIEKFVFLFLQLFQSTFPRGERQNDGIPI